MIRQELIRDVENLNERLAKLKERYNEITFEITFKGKDLIIASEVGRLTQKGYEALIRIERETHMYD